LSNFFPWRKDGISCCVSSWFELHGITFFGFAAVFVKLLFVPENKFSILFIINIVIYKNIIIFSISLQDNYTTVRLF
jgi:hypothetical protein